MPEKVFNYIFRTIFMLEVGLGVQKTEKILINVIFVNFLMCFGCTWVLCDSLAKLLKMGLLQDFNGIEGITLMFVVFFMIFAIELLNDFEFSFIDLKLELYMVLICDEIQESCQ